MKILILSASIGSGHTKAAEAIKNAFKENCEIIDFMSDKVSTLNRITKKCYLSALKFIPDLYDKIYRFAGKRKIGTLSRFISSVSMYFPFVKLLKKFQPDVIICTHPFPESAASLWKFLHPEAAKKFLLATVLTDYSLHEIWIYSEVDIYFVATEKMKLELAKLSRPNQEIYATGIPISKKFLSVERVPNSERKTILLMGGGLGLGSIEETLNELNEINLTLKIIVIAGQNEKLLSRLKKFSSICRHEFLLLGYVENVHEIMQKSDLLITKPGALTMTESFAMGLPMFLHAPIPGPEILNAEYAIKNGVAISASEEKISLVVERLLKNADKLNKMSENAKKISKKNSAEKIAEIIKQNIKE